jgi:transposase-like protein
MVQLSYRRHRFPAEIIQHAIWLYLRFTLSYRDVEEPVSAAETLQHSANLRCWPVQVFGVERSLS